MKLFETLKLALRAISAHKLRSMLTLLGIVLGVAAVVVVVSLIQGFNNYIDEKIADIGTRSFTIQRFSFDDYRDTDTFAAALRRNPKLTPEDFEYLRDHLTLVGKIGVQAPDTTWSVMHNTDTVDGVRVEGLMPVIAEINNVDVAEGRYFNETEDEKASRVVFLGADVADQLYLSSISDAEIHIANIPYRVIGVAARRGDIFGQSQDNYVQIPLNTYIRDFGDRVREMGISIVATAKSDEVFDEAVEEARFILRARRHLGPRDPDNFGIITPDAISGLRDRVFGQIFIAAIAVPSVALLVGGIGIMNIMLVSVTERTKEIGLRKAIGATRRDILKQFLIEAVMLSAIGGAVGVLIAYIAGRIISATFFPTYLSFTAIAVAITVSGMVGVVSGFVPAWKAARLNPTEALHAD
jgi:putative ABC transport system permease protein